MPSARVAPTAAASHNARHSASHRGQSARVTLPARQPRHPGGVAELRPWLHRSVEPCAAGAPPASSSSPSPRCSPPVRAMRRPAPRHRRRPPRHRPSPSTSPLAHGQATRPSTCRRPRRHRRATLEALAPGTARRDRDRRPPGALRAARRGRLDPPYPAAAPTAPSSWSPPARSQANDYTWYRVAPLGFKLDDGVDQGWVAVADHDGTPWVAPVDDPTPGFTLASVTADPHRPVDDGREGAGVRRSTGSGSRCTSDSERPRSSRARGIVFSPYSIATALSMARAGAAGETASEMDDVLRRTTGARSRRARASLAQVLARRDGAWMVEGEWRTVDAHFLALRIANMAFAQEGYALEQAYMERVSRTFRSGVGLVDYVGRHRRRPRGHQPLGRRADHGPHPEAARCQPDVTAARGSCSSTPSTSRASGSCRSRRGTRSHARSPRRPARRSASPRWRRSADRTSRSHPATAGAPRELRYQSPDEHPLAMTIVVPENLAAFEKAPQRRPAARRSRTPSPASTLGSRSCLGRRRRKTAASTPTRRVCSCRSSGRETRAEPQRRR